jgi:diguanylate cyclase (GGDEF)-like protein
MNRMNELNKTRGHSYGDSVLRWMGIVLQEESQSPTYRIGGDDFAVILQDGVHSEHEDLLNRIFDRSNREGAQLGIPTPPARIALIHYDPDNECSIWDVMYHLWETITDVQHNRGSTINVFRAQDLIKSTTRAEEQSPEALNHSWEMLQSIANNAIGHLVKMGKVLDVAQRDSYLDSISGLPNLRAALVKLDKAIENATTSRQSFSILLIDGDNIRRFNSVSYADGDKMIQDMAAVLSENLRPGDFVARWRTGDEFMVILPNTSTQGAKVVGERFCAAIREVSKKWLFPTSISIGIATYPKHGEHVHALVDVAEMANKKAKDAGKDRVVLVE